MLIRAARPADAACVEQIVAEARSVQGRGLGRLLLGHAEDQALQLGLPETRLYTNAAMTENLAIYPRLGYVEVNRRTEDGFDRVYFRKDLLTGRSS